MRISGIGRKALCGAAVRWRCQGREEQSITGIAAVTGAVGCAARGEALRGSQWRRPVWIERLVHSVHRADCATLTPARWGATLRLVATAFGLVITSGTAVVAEPPISRDTQEQTDGGPGKADNWRILVENLRTGQKATAAINSVLSHSKDFHSLDKLESAGCVQALVDLLDKDSPVPLDKTMEALANFSRSEKSHAEILRSGAISKVCEIIKKDCGWTDLNSQKKSWFSWRSPKPPSPEDMNEISRLRTATRNCSIHATRFLSNLAMNSQTHSSLAKGDVLKDMLLVVQETPDTTLKQLSLLCLAGLAKNSEVAPNPELIRSFVENSSHADSNIQWYATGGLRNVCRRPDNHKLVLKLQGIPALVRVLRHSENPDAQLQSVAAIEDLARNTSRQGVGVRTCLIQNNGFEWLGRALGDAKTEKLQQRICRMVAALMDNAVENDKFIDQTIQQFCNSPLASAVVSIISRGGGPASDAVQCATALVRASGRFVDIFLQDGINNLCSAALLSRSPALKFYALELTEGLSERIETHPALQGSKLIERVVAVGQTTDFEVSPALAEIITKTLANFSREDASRTEIAHEGGLALILQLNNTASDPMVRQHCARAIYNLCLGGLSRVIVFQRGGLDHVALALSSLDEKTRLYGAGAAAALCENFECAIQLVQLDVVPNLVKIAEKMGPAARYSILALAEMSNLQETHLALAEGGAVKVFMDAMISPSGRGGNDLEVQQYSALALCNVATSDPSRGLMMKLGAPAKMSTLARSAIASPEVANVANLALANLMNGGRTITQVLPVTPFQPS